MSKPKAAAKKEPWYLGGMGMKVYLFYVIDFEMKCYKVCFVLVFLLLFKPQLEP